MDCFVGISEDTCKALHSKCWQVGTTFHRLNFWQQVDFQGLVTNIEDDEFFKTVFEYSKGSNQTPLYLHLIF